MLPDLVLKPQRNLKVTSMQSLAAAIALLLLWHSYCSSIVTLVTDILALLPHLHHRSSRVAHASFALMLPWHSNFCPSVVEMIPLRQPMLNCSSTCSDRWNLK